jgi:hypothetical protein
MSTKMSECGARQSNPDAGWCSVDQAKFPWLRGKKLVYRGRAQIIQQLIAHRLVSNGNA